MENSRGRYLAAPFSSADPGTESLPPARLPRLPAELGLLPRAAFSPAFSPTPLGGMTGPEIRVGRGARHRCYVQYGGPGSSSELALVDELAHANLTGERGLITQRAEEWPAFGVQSIAVTAGVSAARDAGNAVDDEEDADRNGHDRKDRRAGPYETIPQVGQVCFGLPGTPGEVQEDQAYGGRGAEGEGNEGKHDDEVRRMVTYQNHGGRGGEGPRLLEDPDGGCFPRMELLQAGSELLGDP